MHINKKIISRATATGTRTDEVGNSEQVTGGTVRTEDFEDDIKSFDFAIAFGAGLEYKIGFPSVIIEATYALGLLDISDLSSEVEQELNLSSLRARGVRVMLGILLESPF